MENRQKNYGSVHDTKASMMYNRFLKQYNEWLSGGPIPDTGNQDTKYFLSQQRKRLEKTRTSQRFIHRTPGSSGLSRRDPAEGRKEIYECDRIPHGAEKYDIFQGWTDHRKIPEERDLIPDDHLRE